MDVAFEFDARGVLSGDLDRDGKLDLVVQESLKAGFHRVHVMRNQYESDNGWIGVQLYEEGNGKSPIGATVTAELDNGLKQLKAVVTGDSFTSQHSNWVHFGTGKQAVKSIVVRWPNGEIWRRDKPKQNRYYRAK